MGSVVPVIFITGHGDVEMAVKAMKAKAVDFLTKPVREQDLLDAISVAMQDLRKREFELQRRALKLNHFNALSPREREIFVALCNGKLAKWTCNGFAPVTDLIMPPLLRTPAG
jgi:FixJ family two-component response regulator